MWDQFWIERHLDAGAWPWLLSGTLAVYIQAQELWLKSRTQSDDHGGNQGGDQDENEHRDRALKSRIDHDDRDDRQ